MDLISVSDYLVAEDLQNAEKALNNAVTDIKALALHGNMVSISKITEVAENFLLSENPIKAKALVLAKLIAEFEELKLKHIHLTIENKMNCSS